jgi:2'-deoxynucleoside 5'-phosphate N-hydrolase
MKIYFACSIRGGKKNKKWHLKILEILPKYGQVLAEIFVSRGLDRSDKNLSDRKIYQRDIAWLEKADIVVAEVTSPSLGVGYEIARLEKTTPILCLYRPAKNKKLSAMIAGNPRLTVKKYKDIEEAEKIIESFLRKLKK